MPPIHNSQPGNLWPWIHGRLLVEGLVLVGSGQIRGLPNSAKDPEFEVDNEISYRINRCLVGIVNLSRNHLLKEAIPCNSI